jgi:hypothetical protein
MQSNRRDVYMYLESLFVKDYALFDPEFRIVCREAFLLPQMVQNK